jgi:hypothetical protein
MYFLRRLFRCVYKTVAPKIDPAPWTDIYGVLVQLAEAFPVLEATFVGWMNALKQIRQYTEVSSDE